MISTLGGVFSTLHTCVGSSLRLGQKPSAIHAISTGSEQYPGLAIYVVAWELPCRKGGGGVEARVVSRRNGMPRGEAGLHGRYATSGVETFLGDGLPPVGGVLLPGDEGGQRGGVPPPPPAFWHLTQLQSLAATVALNSSLSQEMLDSSSREQGEAEVKTAPEVDALLKLVPSAVDSA